MTKRLQIQYYKDSKRPKIDDVDGALKICFCPFLIPVGSFDLLLRHSQEDK